MDKGTVDILLAGQTGVGRSTLINMISGASDGLTPVAKVSNDVRPCPMDTTQHTAQLELDGMTLQCNFLDTRGLDEAVDHPNLMDTAAKWLRQRLFSKRQHDRDLRDICRKRVQDQSDGEKLRPASTVILMWCIHASKIDVPFHWQNFRRVYVEYCEKRVKPVVVITQMTPGFEKDWEKRCRDQLGTLCLGARPDDTDDLLLMVRKYRHTHTPEYRDDSLSLRSLVFRLSIGA